MSDLPDIIYAVRPGERNDALRFSLRSLENLPHRRVFIAGYCPGWVKNVTVIPVDRVSDKYVSIERNVKAALSHPELGEECVYMNDDFFILEPIESVPAMHGGSILNYNGKGGLKTRMKRTQALLSDEVLPHLALLTYDGQHVPLPLITEAANDLIHSMPSGVLWRTWYGNMMGLEGSEVSDTKNRDGVLRPHGPFLSSAPRAMPNLKPYLEDVLPRSHAYV